MSKMQQILADNFLIITLVIVTVVLKKNTRANSQKNNRCINLDRDILGKKPKSEDRYKITGLLIYLSVMI